MRIRAGDVRPIAATTVGLLLVGLVGLASGGSPWHGGGHSDVPAGVVRAAAAAAGVLAVGALLLVWVGTPTAEKHRRRRRRLTARDLDELGESLSAAGKAAAVVAAVVGVFLLICLPFITQTATTPNGPASKPAAPPGRTAAPPQASGHSESSATLAWLAVGAAATLLLLTPAAVVVRRRRARRARKAVVPDVAEHVGSGLRASLDELEHERDPRVAIQRAYVRMEESFGAIELVRAQDETPSEFTSRVLRVLGVSAASASDLTELFEIARFSDHTIGEGDRSRAIASMQRVEAEIARR